MKKPKSQAVKSKAAMPDLTSEVGLGFLLSKTIIGVDEVGRGCLAGPVVAAAALLHFETIDWLQFKSCGSRPSQPVKLKAERANEFIPILQVRDSKLVPEADRAGMSAAVSQFVRAYAIAEASVAEIKELNILYASHLAMERAVNQLEQKLGIMADAILVDGNLVPRAFQGRGHALIKGDQKSLTISCASILAKVYRDQMMQEFEITYPGYGMSKHKGYPTAFHKAQIKTLGITKIHRTGFKGVS